MGILSKATDHGHEASPLPHVLVFDHTAASGLGRDAFESGWVRARAWGQGRGAGRGLCLPPAAGGTAMP